MVSFSERFFRLIQMSKNFKLVPERYFATRFQLVPKDLSGPHSNSTVLAEFNNFRAWESIQDSKTCINLTSRPTLILVDSKESLYQSWSRCHIDRGRAVLKTIPRPENSFVRPVWGRFDPTVNFFGIVMIFSLLAVDQNLALPVSKLWYMALFCIKVLIHGRNQNLLNI